MEVHVDNHNTFKGYKIFVDKKGYPYYQVRVNGLQLRILIHVEVWESIYGEKPTGHDIHHKDFNKGNYAPDNLELLSKSDHRRLHEGWVKNDLGEWVAKPCSGCDSVFNFTAFYIHRSGKRKGLAGSMCIICTLIKNEEYRIKNLERKRIIGNRSSQKRRDRENEESRQRKLEYERRSLL
jgi:hypothetical protein